MLASWQRLGTYPWRSHTPKGILRRRAEIVKDLVQLVDITKFIKG